MRCVDTFVPAQTARQHPSSAALDRTLEKSVKGELPPKLGPVMGASVALYGPQGSWQGSVGHTSPDKSETLSARSRFRIGSITKTFVATVAMQQVETGSLNLDDPLSKWFPDFPNAKDIKVRQLLDHTSGIPDYLASKSINKNIGKAHTPEQLIDAAAKLEAALEPKDKLAPGQAFHYSNTNYILLGRILEKTKGVPLERQIRDGILRPLGLNDTYMDGSEKIGGAPIVRGTTPHKGKHIDITDREHTSVAWASGAMVSTPADLIRFNRALFEGKLLSPASMREMTTTGRLNDGSRTEYGLGLGVTNTPQGTLYFHGGSIPGFTAMLGYIKEKGVHYAALSNSGLTDDDDPAARISSDIIVSLMPPPAR